jgi:hypothetical protein
VIVGSKSDSMWKEAVVAWYVVLSRNFPGWSEENHEAPPVRGLNPELSEYEWVQATRGCCVSLMGWWRYSLSWINCVCEDLPWIELAPGGGVNCGIMHAVIHFEVHKSREVLDQLSELSSFQGILVIEAANRDTVNAE